MANNFAHLKEDSPFYELFENGMAPIINSIGPTPVLLEGSDETLAYLLDVKKCSAEQIEGIATRLAFILKTGTAEEIKTQMLTIGMPIRASQVQSVSSDSVWFL